MYKSFDMIIIICYNSIKDFIFYWDKKDSRLSEKEYQDET